MTNQILVDEFPLGTGFRNAPLDTFPNKKNTLVPEQLLFSADHRKDSVEEEFLLTPDNLKNLTTKTKQEKIVDNSGPIKLLDLLAKKELASSKDISSSESASRISSTSIPTVSPSVNKCSPDRWAGHAFSNSPTPGCLPIPSFIDNEIQPTRLTFSPTKQDSPTIKNLDSPLTSQTIPTRQPRPNTKLSPSKKQYAPKPMNRKDLPLTRDSAQTMVIQSSPPTHDLEVLSRNLRNMLNIDPIQS